MQTNRFGNNLWISRHIKSKKILNHDFAAAQPLSKSSGDQVNGTIAMHASCWAPYSDGDETRGRHICMNGCTTVLRLPNWVEANTEEDLSMGGKNVETRKASISQTNNTTSIIWNGPLRSSSEAVRRHRRGNGEVAPILLWNLKTAIWLYLI